METFVLHTNEFGFDMFINAETGAEDKIENATVYTHGLDNPEIKLKYWSAVTGYKNLSVKNI